MLSLYQLCCHSGVKTDQQHRKLLKGLLNTIRAAVHWPSQLGPFRLFGVAVTCPSFTFCSFFCCSKENGLASIISTSLRFFDVSHLFYERKENCLFTLVLCVQLAVVVL